ncbi:MAG: hypothetical protein U1F54_00160 [Burkholderiales bacterium]
MNYFERLWRRARFDAVAPASGNLDDPFAWVAPWPLEDSAQASRIAPAAAPVPAVPAPSALVVGRDGSPGLDGELAAAPAPLLPRADATTTIVHARVDGGTVPSAESASAEPRATRAAEAAPLVPPQPDAGTPLAHADAFMSQLGPALAGMLRDAPAADARSATRLAPSQQVFEQRVVSASTLPLAPSPEPDRPVSPMAPAAAQLSIGEIAVDVRAPRAPPATATRVVVVREAVPHESPRAGRGPMSQRFGIGQV